MTTKFEWIKLILDKWAIILPGLLFLGSAAGWSFSAADNTEKDELTESMKGQIEVLVGYDQKPKTGTCNCNAIFNELIKAHENKHRSEH